jgi:hypothetical protein
MNTFVLLMAMAGIPSKGDVAKLLKKTVKDVKSVSQVFADAGGGRFPVLFVTRGRHCISREVDGQKDENCSATTIPHAALVDGSGVIAELPLPTAAPPWDQPEELKWGITQVKDWDGDGKPELLVIYGYHGPTEWAVGDTYYRDLVLLNLDTLGAAVHLTLDTQPQSSGMPAVESKFKFAGGELTITRRDGDFDSERGERVYKESKQLWARGADDKYTLTRGK